MSRGRRDSEWHVIRRCLAIIRRVQRGPATWKDLVEAVLDEVGPDAYGETEGQPLLKRLRHDLERIRLSLKIDLRADPRTKEYTIRDSELPLLDLPDEDLATLAWLGQTFQPGSPKAKEVLALLSRLHFYLAPARRLYLEQQRSALVLELGQQDQDRIAPEIEAGLTQALARRRRVEFDYLSPAYEDGLPRRHVTDIYEPQSEEANIPLSPPHPATPSFLKPSAPFPIRCAPSPHPFLSQSVPLPIRSIPNPLRPLPPSAPFPIRCAPSPNPLPSSPCLPSTVYRLPSTVYRLPSTVYPYS